MFLFSDFFFFFGAGALGTEGLVFDEFAEAFSGVVAVERLGAFFRHFDFEAGGAVEEANGGGSFVGFLSAGAGGADEGLVEVEFLDFTGFHALDEGIHFFVCDAEVHN